MPISETHNMDCMDYMAQFPDKHFEIAIVDPPYGIGGHEGNSRFTRIKFSNKNKTWDSSTPELEYFAELQRVSENQIVWGGNYFTEFLPPRMGWIVWFKTIECVGRAFSEFEMAWTSFQRAARTVEIKPFQKNRLRIHPTQKPVALYKWLLTNYAKSGDKILDTHLGSGSSRIAAWDLGFDFYATELDKDYFDAQEQRFADHIAQPNMLMAISPRPEQSGLFNGRKA